MIPLVSIVIPCYNAERFLLETLESVLAQTLNDYEIITIDDGSTDDTAKIIKAFGSRIKTVFGPNRGASYARNIGTELSEGEFIQYLDADDLLASDALEQRVQALEFSKADVAYSNWQKLEESEEGAFFPGEIIAGQITDVHPEPEVALLTKFWAPPAALLYRRRIVEKIGGWNTALPIIQDARFALDAALKGGKFIHVPGVGAYYRVSREQSLSRRDPLAFVQDVYINACQVEEWWLANGGLTAPRRTALAQVYDYTARTLFSNDPDMFEDNLRRLYLVQPGFCLSWPKIAGWLARVAGRHQALLLMRAIHRIRRQA